jgi:Cobalamin adenosyltransferase
MSSTHLNLARAVCRRAERSVYPLVHAEQVDAEVGRYLNRLSDFLFAATRAAALREGREELLWRKAVMPSAVANKANTAAALAGESFSAAGSSSHATVGAAQPQTSPAVDHSVDEVEDIADIDLSQHSTQTPAGPQETFHGFGDDFFDPSALTSATSPKKN